MKRRPNSRKENQSALRNKQRKCTPSSSKIQRGKLFHRIKSTAYFEGTKNPRYLRALNALLEGPVMREELDRIAGCSNSPDLIQKLESLGLGKIRCERVRRIDRDGNSCSPGRYTLNSTQRELIRDWLEQERASPLGNSIQELLQALLLRFNQSNNHG